MERKFKAMDRNKAVAHIAYRLNEGIAIYPITPTSPVGNGQTSGHRNESPITWIGILYGRFALAWRGPAECMRPKMWLSYSWLEPASRRLRHAMSITGRDRREF
jgi:hypothetical protein